MWSGRIALIIIRPINLSITAKRQLNVNLKLGSHCSNNELLSHYTETYIFDILQISRALLTILIKQYPTRWRNVSNVCSNKSFDSVSLENHDHGRGRHRRCRRHRHRCRRRRLGTKIFHRVRILGTP